MNIKNRIKGLEKKMQKRGKIPPEDLIHLVYIGDPNFKDKIAKIKKRIKRKYGTLEGLKIYRTVVPEPDPLHKRFKTEAGVDPKKW